MRTRLLDTVKTEIGLPTQPRMVEELEGLLTEVKAGRVTDLAIAYRSKDGRLYTQAWFENFVRMLGAITILQHDTLHQGDVPEPNG